MTSKPGVSRRTFMRSAAAAAAVPTALTATHAGASSTLAHVAATVVRASHSKTAAGRLTIGGEGAGELFVANGGHLSSAEARLGGAVALPLFLGVLRTPVQPVHQGLPAG